jgi:hypothetical protein
VSPGHAASDPRQRFGLRRIVVGLGAQPQPGTAEIGLADVGERRPAGSAASSSRIIVAPRR